MRKKIRIKITKDVAKNILKKAKINEHLIEVKEFYIGWNSIYKIVTNNNEYIVRIFTNNFGKFGKNWKAKKEEYVLKLLNQHKIRVQKTYFSDVSKSLIPYDYIILENAQGIELKWVDRATSGKRKSDFSIKDYEKILKEIGKQMALIHKIKMPRLEAWGFRLDKNLNLEIKEHLKLYLKRCPDKKLRKRIYDYAVEKLEVLPKNPKLVPIHTEFTNHNILVKKVGKHYKFSSLIDMEWFMRALPERELARQTHELFSHHRDKRKFSWRAKLVIGEYYKYGGKIKYPEIIPLMIIDNLLWGMYTKDRAKENMKLIKITLINSDQIIKDYKKIIDSL